LLRSNTPNMQPASRTLQVFIPDKTIQFFFKYNLDEFTKASVPWPRTSWVLKATVLYA
jgi:hypothetical protein